MGDPRKLRKKYTGPNHPWEGERIEGEKKLILNYGLKNKREIWKITSKVRTFKQQVKKLTALSTQQAEKEKEQLRNKLVSFGLLEQDAQLGAVLDLPATSLMERRLQTLVHKKNLARSVKQARQFIVHGHILVNGKKITSPSSIVSIQDEPTIAIIANSPLSSNEHPERTILEPKKRSAAKAPEEKQERRGGRKVVRRRMPKR